ncbi:glycoside hydrolase family 3 N-terminal domain-containing protein [Clostridium grantii]|uniref:Beta-glucosidase n=1 Tax=Clostridium grantii DSM 8605 TaxID=1121316 RepID=A0A1M5WA82_9CLOT|nr:glycoside hydrolase family 3 N-terminal domain-containing protein [Clostridium grantii]SHH84412.1 beta-glucosidase [Clostridium grantii DSM 8605]
MLYKDRTKSIEERVEDLLSKMTLKEKVGQLNQKMLGWNAYKIEEDQVILTKEFLEEVEFGDGVGAIYGLSRADGWNSHLTMGVNTKESVRIANKVQKYIIENTRLGIPILVVEECPHGHEAIESTTFPTNIGIGSSWNTDLYEKECHIIAKELRGRGGHLALISTLDIATDPRWGRTEECYGEDPYLSSKFCESAVRGIQGNGKEDLKKLDRAVVVLKHFCAQGATIGGHNGKATNIGQRELHEIHLLGMKKGVGAGALGCMAAYNDIDGIPCHINRKLLTNILRDEMGFEGIVMSDGCGVDRLLSITGSHIKAGADSLYAGVDLNLWNKAFLELEEAVNKGLLFEKDLDIAVKRVLSVKFKLGLFENPYVDEISAEYIVGSSEAKEVALKMAREVPVLLENKNDILPLKDSIKRIAVIGPNSDKIYNQLGDYTQWQTDEKVTTVLKGIKMHSPKTTEVLSATGCSIRSFDTSGFAEAIDIAEKADVIILVLGGSSTREPGMNFQDNGAIFMDKFTSEIDCGEAVDLADIKLGGVQVQLAKELKKLGKPIVTILIQGRPHAIPWLKENSDAILCGWYPGEKGGEAIGEIVFGKTVPSGKLSISMPSSVAQLPVYYNRKDLTDYIDMNAKPLYEFGYGLSYTTFNYENFSLNHNKLSVDAIKAGKRFEIDFDILNQGFFDAEEVVQLYIYDMESCITRRIKELKDFRKLSIPKNEKVRTNLSVGLEELSIYDYNMDFVLEPGNVRIMIGSSSDNIVYSHIVRIE